MVNIDGLWDKKAALQAAVDQVHTSEVLPPQFVQNSWRKDRDSRGGEVILAVREGYVAIKIETNSSAEEVWANNALPCGSLNLCSFYRPRFLRLAGRILRSNILSWGGGDFNCGGIVWKDSSVKQGTHNSASNLKLLNVANEHSLTQLNHQPTRRVSLWTCALQVIQLLLIACDVWQIAIFL